MSVHDVQVQFNFFRLVPERLQSDCQQASYGVTIEGNLYTTI